VAVEKLSQYDVILQSATDFLNKIREFLATQLNIELPLWLAQLLVLLIVLPLLVVLVRRSRQSKNIAARYVAWTAVVAVSAVSLMIVSTWILYWKSPLLEQIQGEVTGVTPDAAPGSLTVSLLNFRGDRVNSHIDWLTGTGQFLLNYSPEFANPPTWIVFTGQKCHGKLPLHRRDLTQAVVLSFALECDHPT
jgi:hypothetical protein